MAVNSLVGHIARNGRSSSPCGIDSTRFDGGLFGECSVVQYPTGSNVHVASFQCREGGFPAAIYLRGVGCIAVVAPCHRIFGILGEVGGHGGGIIRHRESGAQGRSIGKRTAVAAGPTGKRVMLRLGNRHRYRIAVMLIIYGSCACARGGDVRSLVRRIGCHRQRVIVLRPESSYRKISIRHCCWRAAPTCECVTRFGHGYIGRIGDCRTIIYRSARSVTDTGCQRRLTAVEVPCQRVRVGCPFSV